MEVVIDRISSQLGPKWVLLITKLKLLLPRARYEIESRHDGSKEPRATVLKNCASDCIKRWMLTVAIRDLEDGEKIRRLLSEMYRVDDFKEIVEEINQENFGIGLSGAGVGEDLSDRVVSKGPLMPLSTTQESLEPGYGIASECTTRSAVLADLFQSQEYCSTPNVAPLVSRAEVSSVPWSYGDSPSEGTSLHTISPRTRISVTPDVSSAEEESAKTMLELQSRQEYTTPLDVSHHGVAGATPSSSIPRELAATNLSTLSVPQGSSTDATGGSVRGSASNLSSDTSMATSVESQGDGAYNVPINMGTNRLHIYCVLDVCQRLPESKWKEFGLRLGLREVFLSTLLEEEVEERYFLIIKKWVKINVSVTFMDLRSVLLGFQFDVAVLVLDARLEGDGEVLIRAIENDFTARQL